MTDPTSWNSPAWSILTEFWTYTVFAILCFGGRRTVALVAPLIVAVGLAIVATRSSRAMDTTFEFGFARCLVGFFAGVIAHGVWRVARKTFLPGIVTATVLEGFSIAIVVAFVSASGRTDWTLLAPLVFSSLVLVFAYQRGLVSRLLATKTGVLLGDLSYSIYMTALLVSHVFNKAPVVIGSILGIDVGKPHFGALYPHLNIDLGAVSLNDAYSVVYLGAVVAMSWLTFRLIERPTRAYFNRLASRIA